MTNRKFSYVHVIGIVKYSFKNIRICYDQIRNLKIDITTCPAMLPKILVFQPFWEMLNAYLNDLSVARLSLPSGEMHGWE